MATILRDKLSEKVTELRAANKRLTALNDLNLQLASERDPRVLLDSLCRDARYLVGAAYAVLCVHDGDHPQSAYFTTCGIDAAIAANLERPRIDAGLFAPVMQERRAMRWPSRGRSRELGLPHGYPLAESALACAIASSSVAYGWICLVNKVGAVEFSEEDQQILGSLAAQVGRIYENGSLYAEVRRAERELRVEVAQHRRAADALAESELRFRQLAENISKVFFLVDPALTQFIYVSPAYDDVWGSSCQSLYDDAQSFGAAIHPEDRGRVLRQFAPAGNIVPFAVEFRIVRPDGTVRFVRARGFPIRDGAGNVYRVAGIAEDITENKRIEDELRESERRFRGVLANVEMISLMLDRDGRVTHCNDYLLRLLGFRRGDVLGRDWLDFCVPGETGLLKKVFADLLADQRSAWHHENTIVALSGEQRFIQWSNSVLRSPAGEVVGVASLGKDITEGKRAEEEVRRLNADLERRVSERTAELEAANKELEAFDYSISHDLRAPLSRIEGFGAALLEDFGGKLGPEGKDFVERIASAGQQMSRLVDDLLKLSTVTRGDLHRTRVDVSALARSVFDALHRAEPQRDVELLLPPGLTARADGGLLRIVLENLVGNAWKFTSRRTGAQVEVGSNCSRSGKQVLFVRDNGAGFDRANAQNLFAPFRRLHAQGQFQGSGIGLATVQRIVRRHGGHIWARSVVDEGAIFKFTLSP